MEKEEIKNLMKAALHEEIVSVFAEMLKASEERINRTNEMICMLAEAAKSHTAAYEKHMSSLIASNESYQQLASSLTEATMELTQINQHEREDFKKQLDSYREELHSAKDRIILLEAKEADLHEHNSRLRGKYDEQHALYVELQQKYQDMAEKAISNSASIQNQE